MQEALSFPLEWILNKNQTLITLSTNCNDIHISIFLFCNYRAHVDMNDIAVDAKFLNWSFQSKLCLISLRTW